MKFQAEWRWRAFGRCSVCHSLLQMLWPMLLWVTESERPWSVYTLGSVTLEPAGNVSIWPTVAFIHPFVPKKNAVKHPNRKMYNYYQPHNFSFQYIYYDMFSLCFISLFLNKLFHQQDFSRLEVNYAHSSLTYLMAGLSRGPTRRNWKVCHH